MLHYIARRLMLAIPTIVGVTLLIFLLMKVLPGDPLHTFYDPTEVGRLSPEQRADLEAKLGLDRPLIVQYGAWLGGILKGDLGSSFFLNESITEQIMRRGAISAEIGLISIVVSWLIGLPVGIISALRPNSRSDASASFMAVLFLAIPSFWLGMLIVIALLEGWGYHAPFTSSQVWQDPWRNLQIVGPPGVVLGTAQAALIARMTRSSLFEVFREDYVRTARSKGVGETLILVRHALPNALLPVLTLSGLSLGFILGGSVTVEKAFGTPGLGQKLFIALSQRDATTVQALAFVYAMIFVLVNILVDISYRWVDPRIRVS